MFPGMPPQREVRRTASLHGAVSRRESIVSNLAGDDDGHDDDDDDDDDWTAAHERETTRETSPLLARRARLSNFSRVW